ncbi:hypothetical protein [Dehalobacter sp. 14DCB1]|uniref:hypothetical protein n=1 Tax=Dehalobacter sp. 14DCB1 TaxID=2070227 RepID=UPI00105334A7|nr:hypothetical protein [Dehalobacter sp. 14DCB1]TCX53799.1 hypothetical protein C1I36_03450 [Dehalobacter sp. 14DCB1]
MNNLLFLTNELMNLELQRSMHLPLNFVQFGIASGKMYKHYRNQSTFIISEAFNKRWGNSVVYGGLFHCSDFEFYSRILDAYHVCSMSTLFKNHHQDIHHRVKQQIIPIYFNTLDELARLMYREGEPIDAQVYVGNANHPKITQRIHNLASARLYDGIDVFNFKKLFWEVFDER